MSEKNSKFIWIIMMVMTACGAIQPLAEPSTTPQVTTQDGETVCTAVCAANEAFEFTQCGSELMRALPVGEMIMSLGDCTKRCHDFIEIFNTMPNSLDFNCLVEARDCADVAVCLGVDQ